MIIFPLIFISYYNLEPPSVVVVILTEGEYRLYLL